MPGQMIQVGGGFNSSMQNTHSLGRGLNGKYLILIYFLYMRICSYFITLQYYTITITDIYCTVHVLCSHSILYSSRVMYASHFM